jgi:4-hydroxy-tetrahydrodipicolinate synthase
MVVFSGCYTALVTPMTPNGQVDYEGLRRLVEFQIGEGVSGILAVGTTGESPTLDWNEHNRVIEKVHEHSGSKGLTIAGTGSNSTQETMEGTEHAAHIGVKCVLLVDPYYNGPSSLEIRREYVEPVASRFKEATGNLENMRLTRTLCGKDFTILSGDDDKTFTMMTTPEIAASGVISVISNIAPRAVQDMAQYILNGKTEEARNLCTALQPLFDIVTVKTQEQTPFGPVTCKARNPLAYKTLMNVLGMPSGPCRQPLGKMTRNGIETVLANARKVYEKDPEILAPIEDFFDVSIQERLTNEKFWQGLTYA